MFTTLDKQAPSLSQRGERKEAFLCFLPRPLTADLHGALQSEKGVEKQLCGPQQRLLGHRCVSISQTSG